MKSQTVRLIDVFLLGPGMIYAGALESNLPPAVKLFLIGTGVATILYNGKNYMKYHQADKKFKRLAKENPPHG